MGLGPATFCSCRKRNVSQLRCQRAAVTFQDLVTGSSLDPSSAAPKIRLDSPSNLLHVLLLFSFGGHEVRMANRDYPVVKFVERGHAFSIGFLPTKGQGLEVRIRDHAVFSRAARPSPAAR